MNDAAAFPDALTPLFQGLLTQVRAFGLLARPGDASRLLEEYVAPRMAFLVSIAEPMRETRFLHDAVVGLPFIYNTVQWPAGAAMAGSMGADPAIAPADFLRSLHALWTLQCGDGDTSASTALKIVRAAAWILERDGFVPALRHVLSLQRSGGILDSQSTASALILLVEARRSVDSDARIAGLLFETPDCTAAEWPRRAFGHWDIDPARFVRPDLTDDLEFLIDEAEREVERVLAAGCYDDWLLGQAGLWKELTALRAVFESLGQWEALAWLGRTTRLEEIRADAGGQFWMGHADVHHFPYAWDNTFLSAMSKLFRHTGGDWIERFLDERALLPRALESLALVDDDLVVPATAALPESWGALSAALAPAFAACVLGDAHVGLRRRHPFRRDDEVIEGLASPFFDSAGIADPAVRAAMLALACDPSGQEKEALAQARLVAGTACGEAGLDGRLADLRRKMAIAEVTSRTIASIRDPDPLSSAKRRSQVLELYPYFALARLEQAIALDQAGEPTAALAEIERAILLNYRDAPSWQSLAVILSHLQRRPEAALAKGIRSAIESSTPDSQDKPASHG